MATAPAKTKTGKPRKLYGKDPTKYSNGKSILETEERKEQYLQALVEEGMLSKALDKVGVTSSLLFTWRLSDVDFAKREQEHLENAKFARGVLMDRHAQRAFEDGKIDKAVATLLMFYRKQADPSFRENSQVHITLSGPAGLIIEQPCKDITPDSAVVDPVQPQVIEHQGAPKK